MQLKQQHFKQLLVMFNFLVLIMSTNTYALETNSKAVNLPVDKKIITSCNEGRFKILVTEMNDGSYGYYAWDQTKETNMPSLVLLNGSYMEVSAGSHYDHYLFNAGDYKYIVAVGFSGVGSGVYLIVEHNGKQIFQETCRTKNFNF